METQRSTGPFGRAGTTAALLAVLVSWLLMGFAAQAATPVPLTINVVGVAPDGSLVAGPADFRWTLEQDATKASIPGRPADTSNYSFSFHTSYMPVVAAGRRCNGGLCTPPAALATDPDVARVYAQQVPSVDPDKRYYVSIAAPGFQMGGAPVEFGATGATATVYVNQYPVPTAQLSVFVFNDNSPINGAPDLPQELGLEGFHVHLLEAGGTYGASGGEVTQDAFGNPLGTTYDADGNVLQRGTGIIFSDANGVAVIKNLFPAKYTIVVDPPTGSDWHQTSTIEGTRGIDAWVKNNEPTFFQEFGPPGHHVFIGFTRAGVIARNADNTPVLNGTRTVSGRVVNTHHSRPPVYTFYNGAPVSECWVGLNEANGGRALYATPCNKDSTFSIPNVPDGTYELVIWDDPLDMIIAATTITVAGNTALGDLPVSSWFGRYQGRVFQDIDGTGLPYFVADFSKPFIYVDPVTKLEYESTKTFKAGDLKPSFGEGVVSNIRFRDGSIYQSTTTKKDGTFAFTEVFPFFNWMVGEIDYARYKATSANVVVDNGGPIDPAANRARLWAADKGLFGSNDPALSYDPWTRLNPQLQRTCTAQDVAANQKPDGSFISTLPTECTVVGQTQYFRMESVAGGPGAILLEGMQTFLSTTNHVEWGKTPYTIAENGGIAGIVYYAITRAEDDPRYAAAENWEPGIPRVQVNVYLDCDADGTPDKPANDGTGNCAALSGQGYAYDKPDVDNFPFCWRAAADMGPALCPNGTEKGPEDVKRSAAGGTAFSFGDVFRWGAPGQAPDQQPHWGLGKTDSWDDSVPTGCPYVTPYAVPSTGEQLDCFDGLRNYNQVRSSVFDGGFAFGRVAGQEELPMVIGAEGKGTYILEAVAPPGYLHQGNGDKNVVFGDTLKPAPAALPFQCVGQELDVPAELTLFPGEANPNYSAGAKWNKCDMKAVPLLPGQNAAPNFFMFTEASVAGHGVGFILDDTATEFNYLSPTFGEKYSPPHLPVSVQDWTGREITRVYSDQYGSYNFLVPSTFTINPPYPSGVMPSMMVACMNHPGPIADPADPARKIIDPFYSRNYTTFCYTLQYLPGKTTYLDTPVLPVSAFASVATNPLDCECENGTPQVFSVNNTNTDNGPVLPATGNRELTIISRGLVDVVNPAFNPNLNYQATCAPGTAATCTTDANDTRLKKLVKRDYGFGTTPGSVTVGGVALTGVNWNANGITGTLPAGAGTGQLVIRRGDNNKVSEVGITVHVQDLLGLPAIRRVNPNGSDVANCGGAGQPCKTIQAAIDGVNAVQALAGVVISIAPGGYNEYVILDKRVRLQGWGAGSVTINAAKSGTADLAAWRARINARAGNTFDLLPGQTLGIDPANNEPLLFGAEEGPGVLVVGKAGLLQDCQLGNVRLQIDGIAFTGADSGGGVLASSYACGLEVSNNRILGNYGTYGGGVRVGHTVLTTVVNNLDVFVDAVNRNPNIHHNWIAQNGATEAGGAGGITLGTGSDGYNVSNNYVCGNFSMADGGGLSHLGRSGGLNTIASNTFVFNQTFNQSADPMGGGVSIAGQVPVGASPAAGTGTVTVNANLIQGNQAGAGAGGGVSIARTNGNSVVLTNNMIVNNIAAYTGGGVVLDNAGGVRLTNNTIASNASTATNRQSASPAGWSQPSLPQIAGLSVLSGANPTLVNNILWGNRSYVYRIDTATNQSGLYNPGLGATASYRDVGRVDNAALTADNSVVTTGGTNTGVTFTGAALQEPSTSTTLFVKKNEFASAIDPEQPIVFADQTVTLRSAMTFDETGNFINVIFSPLTRWEITGAVGSLRADYHITDTAVARNAGTTGVGVPATDFDLQARGAPIDIGADEIPPPSADLVITNTDNATLVNPGATLTYQVIVTNFGPSAVTAAPVTDTFTLPAGVTVTSWSCVATADSSCTAGGTGANRTGSVTLSNGGSATFTANVAVGTAASGGIRSTATVAAPAGIVDPITPNNSAADLTLINAPRPTLTVLDAFNRASANTLGANWQQLGGGFLNNAGIRVNDVTAGNTATGTAFCSGALCAAGANAYWNAAGATFGAKQAATFVFANTTTTNEALYLKASGTYNALLGIYPTSLRVRFDGTQVVVETTTNGILFTQAGTLAGTFANGDTLTAMADAGGWVYVWKTTGATTTLLGAVPTTFTGIGRTGLFMPNGGRVDNFAGGTVP